LGGSTDYREDERCGMEFWRLQRHLESGAGLLGIKPFLCRHRLIEIGIALVLTIAALLFVTWAF
jgi:hypothetical protein